MVLGQLLDVALNARLRGVFGEYIGAQEDVFVEFGFAGAIAADGIDVDASADHIIAEDGLITLVGGAGGDDLGADYSFRTRCAGGQL